MNYLDWLVLFSYIFLIILMSWYIGKKQQNKEDYYLAGRQMPAWKIGISIMATQVSAISLIGAPAFIALKNNGGLVWLQYEFAIPLAMIAIMIILIPLFHKLKSITIYEFLEIRFGRKTRTIISMIFLISRGLGSGVALLATGIVTAVCLSWPLAETILLIGVVSIIYTTFGGIVADIYSDIIQLIVLWAGSILTIILIINISTDGSFSLLQNNIQRLEVFNFSATGFGDGNTFGFWPMLIGGLFLYVSYYGCDQSQAQRLLTTNSSLSAQKSLLINGLLRFPLVLTYCAIGILLIPFLSANPNFSAAINSTKPDFLVPMFLINFMPHGLLGLLIAGIFAASMSSIDSALNSLSASTFQDVLVKIKPSLEQITAKKQILISKLLTIGWGIVATWFALQMIHGSETVLELVNKIGSAFYGPVLGVFLLGLFSKKSNQISVILGLICGVTVNIILWQFFPNTVSWLWWNVIGFTITCLITISISHIFIFGKLKTVKFILNPSEFNLNNKKLKFYLFTLILWFIIIVGVGYLIQIYFQ